MLRELHQSQVCRKFSTYDTVIFILS